jgi:chromosome segregation ATPase
VAKAQDAAAAELRLQLAAATAQRRALDAELEAVSASHAALEKKLAAMGGGDGRFEAALADLEELTRERNTLAAELAALRADRGGEDS